MLSKLLWLPSANVDARADDNDDDSIGIMLRMMLSSFAACIVQCTMCEENTFKFAILPELSSCSNYRGIKYPPVSSTGV